MARKAERPVKASADMSRLIRIITVGSIIIVGAVLWGYAVFDVAMRTM